MCMEVKTMLKAKTIEQRNHIEDIAEKHLKTSYREYCDFLYCNVYKNDDDNMELNLRCGDCFASLCVDIPFDMMAEIVDYLREQNNKQQGYGDKKITG